MNSQVLEIDGVDVVGMEYADIIDTLRGAQLPCMLRFQYSIGPDLPAEDSERWDDDYHQYPAEGSEGYKSHSAHTSDAFHDEHGTAPASAASSPVGYRRSPSPRRRKSSSNSPLPATSNMRRDDESITTYTSQRSRRSSVKDLVDRYEAQSDTGTMTSDQDEHSVPSPRKEKSAFKKGLSLFQQDGGSTPKKRKRKKKSLKKRAVQKSKMSTDEKEEPPALESEMKEKPSSNPRRKKKKAQTQESPKPK